MRKMIRIGRRIYKGARYTDPTYPELTAEFSG